MAAYSMLPPSIGDYHIAINYFSCTRSGGKIRKYHIFLIWHWGFYHMYIKLSVYYNFFMNMLYNSVRKSAITKISATHISSEVHM